MSTLEQLKRQVLLKTDISRDIPDEELLLAIDYEILEVSKTMRMSVEEKKMYRVELFNAIKKLDILQELVDNDEITEIMVNGPDNIFVEKSGKIIKVDKRFTDRSRLEDVIQNIVSKANRIVNASTPITDTRLMDGSRVNIVLNPIALDGPVITIRKFPKDPVTINQLIKWESISEEAAEFLRKLVLAGYNIFISGGTGSGKTTFLNVLSNYIPKDERVITIEDSAELQIRGVDNLVRLETRNSNIEGEGEITMRDLIKSSLRMRPDRIIVGEVRGAEALDMIQAMNTGHDGSISTGHANSPEDMVSRLETMVLMGMDMPLSAIRSQIGSAIDIIVHLGRLRDRSRRVLKIIEVVGYDADKMNYNTLYEFVETDTIKNRVKGELVRTDNQMINTKKLQMAGIKI
ncbi:MAG: CpaF family protein [Lachnospiraceae bacterium]|nr:CpaF family protein [Lachnospiraceae bacterium]MBU5470913.1 CpaF family protein [Falcatimonas sp. MSJ-15]